MSMDAMLSPTCTSPTQSSHGAMQKGGFPVGNAGFGISVSQLAQHRSMMDMRA